MDGKSRSSKATDQSSNRCKQNGPFVASIQPATNTSPVMSDNAPVVPWDCERTPHVVEARDRFPDIALSTETCALVRVLNPAREVAWATDTRAKQKVKPVIHDYQAVAMLLQERGNELEDKNCCSVCANGGTFQTCLVTPILSSDNRTLGFFGGACSNCIWVKKAGPVAMRFTSRRCIYPVLSCRSFHWVWGLVAGPIME
ncbi:hypothetical protein BDV33DRAFT_167457 [Aspergillus novoparasiticus]|uniref:Uncharacterized protein n=1 Tax=Aspergillus novoparasiticus TaxID=986946 RepID=A0A5N6F0L6_9EURO|nr:hypothetical protein BDV33DRAFT_167457 [Aspergillus novoparasiticus]